MMSTAQLEDDGIQPSGLRLESSDYVPSGSGTHGSGSASQDDDDDNLSDSSESLLMPYTENDIQLPPHPKKLRWTDEATGDDSSLESTRIIPGGRLGNSFWYLEDLPEGSSFRRDSMSIKERRKHKQRRQKERQQRVETENADNVGVGDDSADTVTAGVTPDDCVEPVSSDPTSFPEEVVLSPSGDDSSAGVESDTTGRSGWGASRALRNVEDTSEENAEANIADTEAVNNNDEGSIDAEGASAEIENNFDDEDSIGIEHIEDKNEEEDEETENLAAGQQIENSIQNIAGFQKEKLVEAMMNDILKSMRAIEKQKRREEENKKHGSMGPSNTDASAPLSPVVVNKIHDAGTGPVPDGFSSWEAFSESCNAFHLDPINDVGDAEQSSQGTNSSISSDETNDSDFFVDLLTNEIVDDFVKAHAVEWMDDAQKDDDDGEGEGGDSDADFDESPSNNSNTRIRQQPASKSDDPLMLKHRFLAVDGKGGPQSDGPIEIGDTSMAASANRIQNSHSHSPLPARQLSRGKSKKKSKGRKRSFAKKMFKLSLQSEIEETKRRAEIRRLCGRRSSLSDRDADELNAVRAGVRGGAGGRGGISNRGQGDGAHTRRRSAQLSRSYQQQQQQQRPRQKTVNKQQRRGPPQPGRSQGGSNMRSDGVRATRRQVSGTSAQQRHSQTRSTESSAMPLSSARGSGDRVGNGQINGPSISYGGGAGAGAHGQCRPSKTSSLTTGKDNSRPRRQQQRFVPGTGTMAGSAVRDGDQNEKKKKKKLFPNLKEERVEPR